MLPTRQNKVQLRYLHISGICIYQCSFLHTWPIFFAIQFCLFKLLDCNGKGFVPALQMVCSTVAAPSISLSHCLNQWLCSIPVVSTPVPSENQMALSCLHEPVLLPPEVQWDRWSSLSHEPQGASLNWLLRGFCKGIADLFKWALPQTGLQDFLFSFAQKNS